jgi:hypothetical protein
VKGGHAWIGSIETPVNGHAEGTKVRLIVRAYDLKFWVDPQGPAKVNRVLPLGDRVRVEAELLDGAPIFAQFPRRSSLLLGIEPGSELRELERAVLAREPALARRADDRADAPPPGLPAPATPLVGRTEELDEVGRLHGRIAYRADRRGWIGQTRLAIQLATDVATEPGRRFWVPSAVAP